MARHSAWGALQQRQKKEHLLQSWGGKRRSISGTNASEMTSFHTSGFQHRPPHNWNAGSTVRLKFRPRISAARRYVAGGSGILAGICFTVGRSGRSRTKFTST